jgi:hypothetical protein
MKLATFCRIKTGMLILSAFLPIASAQQSGNQGGNTGNPGNGSGTTSRKDVPRPTFPTPSPPTTQVPSQPIEQPVFLDGTVVSEDGSPPPFGAVIEMVCMGSVTREANVASNGYFTFQVGGDDRANRFPDASQSLGDSATETDSTLGSMPVGAGLNTLASRKRKRLFGCDVRAQLHDHNSTSLTISEEPQPGQYHLGTIVVYPLERVRGTTVSLTSMLAPKSARKMVDQSLKAVRKNRLSDAEAFLKSAVQEYPQYAEAWFELGLIYERQDRVEEAYGRYYEAIQADKLYVKPYLRLAELAAVRHQWREAVDMSEQVLTLDPVTSLDGYYVNALAHLNLSELEIAETRARRGQRLDFSKRYPQFHLILADILALRRDTAGSIRELRTYLDVAPNSSNAANVRSQLRKMEEQAKAGG